MTTQSLMIILESYVGGPNEPGEIPVKSQTEILFSTNHYLFSIQLGISSSQLTNSIIFQRGFRYHQPV